MNNKDRNILERLYNCLKIPAFSSGSQSTSVRGLALYAKDCAYAIPKVQEILFAIGSCESYSGEAEELLSELESWFQDRQKEGW